MTQIGHSKRFLHILGIHGDPVEAKQKMDVAKRTGNRIANPYGYDRAFKFLPSTEDKVWLREQAARMTGADPLVLDPTAGGGSIPFEADRLGLSTISNELNPDDPRALFAAGLSGRRWSGTLNTGRPTRTQPKSVSQKRPNMLVRPSNMPLGRSAPRNQRALHLKGIRPPWCDRRYLGNSVRSHFLTSVSVAMPASVRMRAISVAAKITTGCPSSLISL